MPKKPSKTAAGQDARFLSAKFVDERFDELSSAFDAHLAGWGAHGWRVTGREPYLRAEVSVARAVQHPANPVRPIRVAGRSIKPAVHVSLAHLRRARRTDGSNPSAAGLARAIAPGARVRVGRGATQEFVGIAAILGFGDGTRKLLTCGHADAFAFSGEILAGDSPDGDAVATLDRNFLGDPNPLDAAICTLTDAGETILESSGDATTWKFKTVHTPALADNTQTSVFWETHDGDDSAPTAPVLTFNGHNAALFGPSGPQAGFIETSHGVEPGDSGSLLSLGSSLYGICSGFVGFTAFFTPIASVIGRLKSEGTSCSVFTL